MCGDKKALVLYSAKDLKLDLPEPKEEIKIEGKVIKEEIENTSSYQSSGRVFLRKESVRHIISTDAAFEKEFYLNLDDDDKIESGTTKNVSVESVQKEISKRIQEPRDSLQVAIMKYAESCLIKLRDNPELVEKRELVESRNRKDLPKVKKKMLKAAGVTNSFDKPVVHHKDRVADKPRRTLDETNMVVLEEEQHKEIHRKGIDTEEKFNKYLDNEN